MRNGIETAKKCINGATRIRLEVTIRINGKDPWVPLDGHVRMVGLSNSQQYTYLQLQGNNALSSERHSVGMQFSL